MYYSVYTAHGAILKLTWWEHPFLQFQISYSVQCIIIQTDGLNHVTFTCIIHHCYAICLTKCIQACYYCSCVVYNGDNHMVISHALGVGSCMNIILIETIIILCKLTIFIVQERIPIWYNIISLSEMRIFQLI